MKDLEFDVPDSEAFMTTKDEQTMAHSEKADSAREHELKTWPQFFDVIERGIKTFEIREQEDGRHFVVGDRLRLREWNPQRREYTGREVIRVVTYITKWEQKRGFVVMAIVPLT